MEMENAKVPTKGRRIVPLVNVFSSINTAAFPTDVTLEPLADWERAKLFDNPFLAGSMSWWNKHRTRFKLQQDYPLSSDLSDEAVITTINAMRLHKSGDIGAPVVIDFQFSGEPPTEKTTPLVSSIGALLGPPKIVGDFYLLEAGDVKRISELSDLLRTPVLKENKRLSIALTRFGHLYERNRPEDSILDCFIAFETCLTPTIATELQYRLSLRGAALLCKRRPPVEVRSMLSWGYEMRSKIVHEGRGLADLISDPKLQKRATKSSAKLAFPTDVARCVLYYEELTRELIKEMVERLSTSADSIESIVEALDNEIAGGLTPSI